MCIRDRYTVEVWSAGYRMRFKEIDLQKNERITLNLKKLKNPSVAALNAFYFLSVNPSKALTDEFNRIYLDFTPLSGIYSLNAKKLSVIKSRAEAGDAESNFILGVHLSNQALQGGQTWMSDIALSKKYLKRAYAQGFLASGAWLAKNYSCSFIGKNLSTCSKAKSDSYLYEVGKSVPLTKYFLADLIYKENETLTVRQRDMVKDLAIEASVKGVHFANHLLGDIAEMENRPSVALKKWTESANKGNTKSMLRLASKEKNKSISQNWIKKAHEQGDVEAGIILTMSRTKQDPKEFFKLATAAASSNSSSGYFAKGWAFYQGIGTSKDKKKALANFNKCKSNINCDVLSKIISNDGINSTSLNKLRQALEPFDNKRSIEKMLNDVAGEFYYQIARSKSKNSQNNFTKSASLGNPKAISELCTRFSFGIFSKTSIAPSYAFQYCSASSDLRFNDSAAMNYLGKCFEQGLKGCSKSLKKASAQYNKACNLKDGSACCSLARINSSVGLKNFNLYEDALIKARQNNFLHCDSLLQIRK